MIDCFNVVDYISVTEHLSIACFRIDIDNMKPKFREDKITQAAALLLKLRGSSMSHLKLMKLLYLADREALIRWRRPISFDSFVSMPKGPVLSQTLNVIHGEADMEGPWNKAISSPKDHEVALICDPGLDMLSDAEECLIREIFETHGRKSRWELCELTHDLPEWQDPEGSSIPIEYRDVLRFAGKSDGEIKATLDEIENIALLDMSTGQ